MMEITDETEKADNQPIPVPITKRQRTIIIFGPSTIGLPLIRTFAIYDRPHNFSL